MIKKLLILIIIILFNFACDKQQEAEKIGIEGVKLFNSGDIKGALLKFNEVIIIDSSNYEAYMRKADCLDILGDNIGSIKNYSKSIELNPKNKVAYYNRALSFEKIGEFNKTIHDYNSAISIDPNNNSELDNKLIFMNLGIIYGKLNQLDNAIYSLKKAVEIDDKYADAFYNLGYAYQLKGEHKIAIEYFDKAIAINPNEPNYKNLKRDSEKLLN